jgi:DNA helicase HerA-like ATPase
VSDFTLEPQHTLVVGMTGAGKTTLVISYLLNTGEPESDEQPPACRFIFDPLNRVWPRLKLRPAYTANELEASLVTRWSIFNHERMFRLENFVPSRGVPTPIHAAFRSWCKWIADVAARGPGRKIICIPEIWQFCTQDSLPPELAYLAQAGREHGVELLIDTQRPELLNPALTGQCTELVCFKLASPEALNTIKKLGADREAIAALPPGSFVSYNRLSGGVLEGRMF